LQEQPQLGHAGGDQAQHSSGSGSGSASGSHTGHHAWGYTNEDGPSTWANTYDKCAGKQQSPIDIKTKAVKGGAMKGALKINFHPSRQGTLTAQNNGHTIKVSGKGLDGDSTSLVGHEYKLLQFHFHHGSETRVDGKQFPLEAHFVHQDTAGKYLVVAVLFDEGGTTKNRVLSQVRFDKLAKVGKRNINGPVVPTFLLPKDREFFYYMGSFTTPPCTEGVTWTVMQGHPKISADDIAAFPFKNNFRPPQPLNGV
jgi:carbonic anhydrase